MKIRKIDSGLLIASLLLAVAAGDEDALRVRVAILLLAAVAKAALVQGGWEGMSWGDTGRARPACGFVSCAPRVCPSCQKENRTM